jgi:small subunit ribosomal protein S4e
MARGPIKHLKRLNAPKHWMLDKLGGTWAPRSSQGPHKLRESLPLTLVLRNRLRYALTRREVLMVVMRRNIQVDGKIRTDLNYPAGFMDVITIKKTNEHFRLLYDVKGRFVLHRITPEEASYKLCRVIRVARAKKASIGRNPFQTGQAAVIPYGVTHDGRTIRFIDPIVKANDTIKIDIATGKQIDHIKFDVGQLAMITRGHNIGRVGSIVSVERHPGSFDIVHLRDRRNGAFATRLQNVFVIGAGNEPHVSLPKGNGIKLSILEEREKRASA